MLRKIALTVSLACCLALGGCSRGLLSIVGQTPSASPTLTTQSATPGPTLTPTPNATALSADAQKVLDYFLVIALESEYGNADSGIVRRWEVPIVVAILGKPTAADRKKVTDLVAELGALSPNLRIAMAKPGETANMNIHFLPLKDMAKAIPSYVEGNWGYVSVNWDSHTRIYKAVVAIATDVTNQQQRNHLIMEESIQGLGLLNDSLLYTDSIFYGKWTETQAPVKIDFEVITLLYSDAVFAGQTKEEATEAITQFLLAHPLQGI
jgi:hypothetical protein